jgi:hypothetical protein
LTFSCPCLIKDLLKKKNLPEQQQTMEQNNLNDTLPATIPEFIVDDDLGGVSSPLVIQIRSSKGAIDNDGMTCDTVLIRNEYGDEDLLTDENDVTIQQSSYHAELPSNHTPISIPLNNLQRHRSNSDGYILKNSLLNHFADNKSLR